MLGSCSVREGLSCNQEQSYGRGHMIVPVEFYHIRKYLKYSIISIKYVTDWSDKLECCT